jgi:hypothetical protein
MLEIPIDLKLLLKKGEKYNTYVFLTLYQIEQKISIEIPSVDPEIYFFLAQFSYFVY